MDPTITGDVVFHHLPKLYNLYFMNGPILCVGTTWFAFSFQIESGSKMKWSQMKFLKHLLGACCKKHVRPG